MKVKCICIDDSNRPPEIPKNKWLQKDKEYHICHVYYHPMQGNVLAVDLSEIQLTEENYPYETFKLSRFAIPFDQLDLLHDLIKICNELDEVPKDLLNNIKHIEKECKVKEN